MKKITLIQIMVLVGVAVVAGALITYFNSTNIDSFEKCAAAGLPVMESYPRQCRANGKTYVEKTDDTVTNNTGTYGGCVPAGCSGTICAEATDAAEIITTCEYRNEYVCYKLTKCERQGNGRCGWTPTMELTRCLNDPPLVK